MTDLAKTRQQPDWALPGAVVADKYVVEGLVGSGGMGVILAVRHQQLGQRFAMKLMTAEFAAHPTAAARFLREAQAAATLKSEHVVKIFDVGKLATGEPYMLMELLEGSDLSQVLDVRGRLEVTEAVEYASQAGEAIAEAHRRGIIHRDLKPGNLFLTERSNGAPLIKVLDFGISKATVSVDGDTEVGELTGAIGVVGSPLYMSPEQIRDARHVDGRSDVWALGVILYELISGELVFKSDTLTGICAAITADAPRPLSSLVELPEGLDAVVMRCLEKRADRRYQNVDELLEALAPYLPPELPRATRSSAHAVQPLASDGPNARTSPSGDASRRHSLMRTEVDGPPLDRTELPASSTVSGPRRGLPLAAWIAIGVIVLGIAILLLGEHPQRADGSIATKASVPSSALAAPAPSARPAVAAPAPTRAVPVAEASAPSASSVVVAPALTDRGASRPRPLSKGTGSAKPQPAPPLDPLDIRRSR